MIPLVIFLSYIVTIMSEKITDPTLKPANPFSASEDAKIFSNELQSVNGNHRDKLAEIWFKRTAEQRNQINGDYYKNYCAIHYTSFGPEFTEGCPLISALEDLSHNSLDDLYASSLRSAENYLAVIVFNTIHKVDMKTEVGAIEEALCANDKDIKDGIAKNYELFDKKTLEESLKSFRKDEDYQHVMIQYCLKGLCQDKKIKPEDADKEAQALRAIDPDKDKDGFKKKLIELLDKNCEPDLKQIFQKYRKENDGISDAVDKAFKVKRVRRAYNRLVRYVEDTCKFYADELKQAVDGCGTNTDKINRIILSRCERDLGCILKKYQELHKEKFTDRLKSDTLGEPRYRQCIRYLCGEEK